MGYERKHMVALIASLHLIADFKKIFEQLATLENLDYVFDLCKLLDTTKKSSKFIEMVIEAFKVSVQFLQPMTALRLFYQYDLMLLAYQANLAPFVIQELQESPYLIEAKFKIIDKFIDVLDQPTMLKLLDIINDIMEFKGDLQNNVVLNNTLPPMVRI